MLARFWALLLTLHLLFVSSLAGIPTVVPDRVPCVFLLETHFFIESIVNQGLSLYNVREELWLLINMELKAKSLKVPELMKKRTAYLVPNPIEYPMQPTATALILKEVLAQVFLDALRKYQITDRSVGENIFEYIFNTQKSKFIECFGEEFLQDGVNQKPKV